MRPTLDQIQVPAGTTDGETPVYDADLDELVMTSLGSGIDAVVVTVVNGVPMLMFDADSTPVTTEVPS